MKPSITPEMVEQVYNGRPGCACGCRGNYSTTKRSITLALKKFHSALSPVPPGTKGTVTYIDAINNIGVDWDNGRRIAVILPVDQIRKI